jgi:hypothetical protein
MRSSQEAMRQICTGREVIRYRRIRAGQATLPLAKQSLPIQTKLLLAIRTEHLYYSVRNTPRLLC